jgi:exonuclease SbcC
MKIVEITLENFKNHENDTYTFSKGINAICGPNGSGKTSILEAVSWALFDYLPYKKQDQIIKMTRSEMASAAVPNRVAKIQVTFISELDKKKYTVYRSTKSQYFITDTETNERLCEGKREILTFLKKHYNLPSTSNLEDLFTNTIGVPQGTLTAIFLETAANRKKVFDKVLNLEDFREAHDKLRDFKTYLKNQLTELQIKIAGYSTDTEKIPLIEEDIKETNSALTDCKKNITLLKADLKETTKLYDHFETLNNKRQKLKNEIEKYTNSLKYIEKNLEESRHNLNNANTANKELQALKPAHQEYLSSKQSLKEQEFKNARREELSAKLTKLETEKNKTTYEFKSLQDKMDDLTSSQEQIKQLVPLTNKQIELERQLREYERFISQLELTHKTIETNKKELEQNKEKLEGVQKTIQELNTIKPLADTYEDINKEYLKLTSRINELESTHKEHREMAGQIEGGLCPFLKEKCKNLEEGKDLDSYFETRINSLINQIKKIKEGVEITKKKLLEAQEAQNKYKSIAVREEEKKHILEIINKIESDIKNNETIIAEYTDLKPRIDSITAEISELGSPKEKIQLLKEKTKDEKNLKNKISKLNNELVNIVSSIKALEKEIEEIHFDSDLYKKLKSRLNELEPVYNKYHQIESTASSYDKYNKQLQELELSFKNTTHELNTHQTNYKEIETEYDADKHLLYKNTLENKRLELARQEVILKTKTDNLKQLKEILKNLIETKEKIKEEEKQIKHLEKIDSFIDVSRDIFKNCSPKIGQFYIENISLEANRLYQDITGNQSHELIWNADYDISIEENGYSRTFQNLSGGEQMSAALAVRLALLKELSDINIAFFDEPTTNMDEQRRSNLAREIKNLTSFDQLFVISHDDTFEKDIENVIRME